MINITDDAKMDTPIKIKLIRRYLCLHNKTKTAVEIWNFILDIHEAGRTGITNTEQVKHPVDVWASTCDGISNYKVNIIAISFDILHRSPRDNIRYSMRFGYYRF